jgi:eukaryotic-like serine/threonine-protein kinase
MTALSPGDHLDRYELLCVLAQGGMGTVWLARMTGKLGFERLVALKTILPSYTHDRQFCDMFVDEARIASQIDHENVARILEIGEDRGFLYHAMELIDGESLRKLQRDVKAAGAVFPMGVALRIAADTCAGLHATHEVCGPDGAPLDVVHRDVSPQNLLVSIRGSTKLIDFGVAKASARRTEETAVGTLKGKIEYMAPEQARGEPLDRRADVYAVGAVLYELLAGRPLRDTSDGKQLAALHELMTGAPYEPLPPSVPDIVRAIVDRALARDPAARFGTCDELRVMLEQAMLATGHTATWNDVAEVLARFSRERTAKRRGAIEQALRVATEGRLTAPTIVAPLSATQLPATGSGSMPAMPQAPLMSAPPHDGPATGPSMRTMQGASLSSRPEAATSSSAARIAGAAFLLVAVALLGVVGGVVATRHQQASEAAATVPEPTPVVVSAAPFAPPPPPTVLLGEPATPATGVVESPEVPPAKDAGVKSVDAAMSASPPPKATPPKVRAPAPWRPPPKSPKPSDGDEYGF